MSSFIRESKFRNIEVKLENREKYYDQLRVFNGSVEGCNLLTCNSKLLAYIDATGSGSSLAVLPLSSIGKVHSTSPNDPLPLIRAHSQAIQDFTFDKFNTSLLHTCSSDGRLKSWFIPSEGLVADCSEPIAMFTPRSGFSLRGIAQHPSANGITAVRGNRDIALLDLHANDEISSSANGIFKNDLQSMAWSFTGHVLLSTAKDKMLRLFDLRLPSEEAVVATANAHTGTRSTSCVWLGDSSYFLTTGHSTMMDREMMIWDERKLDKPLKKERIDGSTSPIMPFYDNDSNILTLCGKGDAIVRVYEANAMTGELYPIISANVGDIFRGAALLPKQACDMMNCEVLRVLKLSDSSIQPVSITVPRKEKRKFHDDLYPATTCEAPPAMTNMQYREGMNMAPERVELELVASVSGPVAVDVAVATSVDVSMAGEEVVDSMHGVQEIIHDIIEGVSTSSADDNEATATDQPKPSLTPKSRVFSNFTSALKFRHMYGNENPKTSSYYNLLPQISYSDSPLIAANDTYWAIPYQGGGGPVYVSRHDAYGKVEPGVPVINGQKAPVMDISFSPFHQDILATASTDSTVKVWKLPVPGDEISLSDLQPSASCDSHVNAVKTCAFHPVIESMLVTSSVDQTVRLYDINAGNEVSRIDIVSTSSEASYPNNLSFNYDGSLFALACKDRIIRIIDPKAGCVAISTPPGSVLGRNLTATWCYKGQNSTILSTSASSSGMRMLHMWDPRNMNEALNSTAIDNAAGQLFPIFDEDTGICFLVGKGDTIFRFYEVNIGSEGAVCLKSNDFQSGRDPVAGICMLPKRCCNIRDVEVTRLLKLTTDSVMPISFTLPRAENLKPYFHDDIFIPTRSMISGGSISDWLDATSDSIPQPVYTSLKPDDMMNVSERPVETQSKRQSMVFKEEIDKNVAEAKERDETFARLQNLAIQRSKFHPNASNTVKIKGEAQPIIDDNSDDDGWDD